MPAELLKIRSMPTPFWCGVAMAVSFVIGLVITFVWGVGHDLDALAAIEFPTAICSVVLGVWIFGVEYGQNTMRRSLTADPNRVRLILTKAATALAVVVAVTVLLFLLALPLYGIANSGHDFGFSVGDLARQGAATVFGNAIYVLVGAGFALVTASMAGGMTAALVFIFVLDGVLSIIPKVSSWTFGLAMSDVVRAIVGSTEGGLNEGAGHGPAVALLLVAAWLTVLLGLGVQRLLRSDVK